MPLSPQDQAILDELWRRKEDQPWLRPREERDKRPPPPEYIGVTLAELTQDVEMHVWNGRHPPEGKNMKMHIAKKGTTVLIWTVSRFGDVGVTDNLVDAIGYQARVDPEVLVNWRFK